MKNYFKKLNKSQKKAVTHGEGPLLIVAGAGTGKTTVITSRLAWLINQGLAEPEEILALTFTNKAAGEMEERVDRLISDSYLDLWVMTFHSFAHRVLQEKGLEIGLPTDFDLLDQTDSWLLLRKNLEKLNLDYYKPLGRPTKFIHAMISHFSKCKDQGVTPSNYLKYAQNVKDEEERKKRMEIARAYQTYQDILLNESKLDFGDLINYTIKLFQERKNVKKEYQNMFKYILVDEFQDTNRAQYDLLKILSPPKENITVTADDDQSIYKFRGASFGNIIQFRKDFPDSKMISITKNYRSRQKILDLSYNFIQKNNPNRLEAREQIDKKLKAEKEGKGEVAWFHFKTEEEEVLGIAEKIKKLQKEDKKADFSDFAVLVRTNNAAISFCRSFERLGIPHRFLALRGLYYKPIIMDTISYFTLLTDRYDSRAFYRILKMPPFDIKGGTVSKLSLLAKKKSFSLFEAAEKLKNEKIKNILSLIEKHSHFSEKRNVSEVFISFLEDTDYLDHLNKKKDIEGIRYINEFYSRIKAFENANRVATLSNFLKQIELELEAGEEGEINFDPFESENKVKILTVHKAKGLEFKYVFLPNLVKRRFPTIRRSDPIELPDQLIRDIVPEGNTHLEEERRLFYVGMTRSKKGLFLTSALDYGGVRKKRPSRFLEELEIEKGKMKTSQEKIRTHRVEKQTEGNLKIPSHFSFSQFQAFKSCPLQYKFAHVLKIPIRGKAFFSYGKTMHNTLERFVSEDVSTWEKLLEIYEEEWIEDWFNDQEEKEKYFKLGKESLKIFLKDYQKNNPEVLKINGEPALEKNFRLKIGEDTVVGKIDRVDRVENGAELIDYKTGRVKEKLRKKDKEQLLIYQIAAEEALDLKPKKLTYYYLNEGKKLSFLGEEEQLKEQKSEMKKLIERIKKKNFDPDPGWQCKFCDFKKICEYAKQ